MTSEFRVYTNERGYKYICIPSGWQGRSGPIVWIHHTLVEQVPPLGTARRGYERIKFPAIGAMAVLTPKGGCVIRSHPRGTVYFVEVESGLNGVASLTSVSGGEVVMQGKIVRNPGQVAWALINSAEDKIIVSAHRTGRRITREDVILVFTRDGRVKEDEGLDEGVELLLSE